jgi:RNA polymerase sigma factor (sigma-70 family)
MNKLKYKNYNIVKLRDLPVEELIGIYKNCNSPAILNLIVKKTEKLAYKVAGEFKNNQWEKKDIQQVAFTGLIIAINRFNPGACNKFSTYAVHCIKGEIFHFIRDSRLIKTPRWLWRLNKLFSDFVKNFEINNNRYPTIEEISAGINISIEGINEFLKAREVAFYNFKSIDKGEENNPDSDNCYDKKLIKSKEYKSFDLVMEDKILLWDAIDKLCSLNKKILILSYFLGFSQKEIGKKIGISQKSVSRKLEESIKILKGYYANS